nr:hypothetical protein [Kibdelosporangium sp. MJ126-NF4]CTQ98408.1 hypothetical protein [Kibdelosporangium sp. MJ126-NF4]
MVRAHGHGQDPVKVGKSISRSCVGGVRGSRFLNGLRANAQGCGSWGVPPVWPGRSHTTACREVGLRNPTHSAGGTDLPARRGFLWQVIREGRPAPQCHLA